MSYSINKKMVKNKSEVRDVNKNHIGKVLGSKSRARYMELIKSLDQSFKNPIIHREINGDKIYVSLDLNRIWNIIH